MGNNISLTFDEQSYSITALQKAAYRGINFFTADITSSGGVYHCALKPNIGINSDSFSLAVEEFRKDALDYHLREKISTETESVRNLILATVFSRTGMQGNE